MVGGIAGRYLLLRRGPEQLSAGQAGCSSEESACRPISSIAGSDWGGRPADGEPWVGAVWPLLLSPIRIVVPTALVVVDSQIFDQAGIRRTDAFQPFQFTLAPSVAMASKLTAPVPCAHVVHVEDYRAIAVEYRERFLPDLATNFRESRLRCWWDFTLLLPFERSTLGYEPNLCQRCFRLLTVNVLTC